MSDDSPLADRGPNLDPNQQRLSAEFLAFEATAYSGPLPPPATLAEYERVVPGLAERIVVQFEEQGRHRRTLELKVVESNATAQLRGQIVGGVIAIAAMVTAIVLMAMGLTTAGIVLFIADFATLAAVFITGRRGQEREREARNPR